jgi:hypothetical protein
MRYTLFVILFSLFSCKNMTKESYISNYELFINKVELNSENYTLNDWSKKDSLFEIYSVNLFNEYKSQLTSEERNKINNLTGKYTGLRISNFGKDIYKSIEDFGSQFESMFETISEELNHINDTL